MDKRMRSPNYPALSLPEAIDKVTGIYRTLHNHPAPREVVAKAMGYTGLNGASATAVSALRKYGLLDRNGEDLRVSERALRILHPHSAAEKAQALMEAAREPPLFAEIGQKFPGRHPNDELLRNYLVRNGFAPAALTAVISAYRDTSDMVAALADDHDPSVDRQPEESEAMIYAPPAPATPVATGAVPPHIGAFQAGERPLGRYDFEGGAYVRIAAFGEVETEQALDMIETLITLKRKELERANKRTNSAPASVIETLENDAEDLS